MRCRSLIMHLWQNPAAVSSALDSARGAAGDYSSFPPEKSSK